jgi:hypothetical protein
MYVVRVITAIVQTNRPAAVEAGSAAIAAAQDVISLADMLAVTRDGCGKGLKQRLNDRILAARQILGRFGTPAQRLIEKAMPVRIVQSLQARTHVR